MGKKLIGAALKMDLAYNELSFSSCYPDKHSAIEGLHRTLAIAWRLNKLGYNSTIRVVKNFKQQKLAPDYGITDWMNDKAAHSAGPAKELFRFFCTNCTKSPYLEDCYEELSLPVDVEYRYQGQPSLGLAWAYIWDTLSLSLDGDEKFKTFNIDIVELTLNENGEVAEKACVSHTLSRENQIAENRTAIKQKLLARLRCGADIIESAKKYFPNLLFCENAEKQLKEFTGSEEYFGEVIRHLYAFDGEKEQQARAFLPKGISYASKESTTTENNKKYRKAREFKCPDGEIRYFGAHSKLMSANKRIHIFPYYVDHNGAGKVLVGYVGDHLPVSSQ